MSKYWYRYDDIQYAPPLNEWDEPEGEGEVKVWLTKYKVISLTPKGAWLMVDGRQRWTKRDAIKRFACPTIEEAKESFIARKTKQIAIYHARIKRASKAIRLVQGEPTIEERIAAFDTPIHDSTLQKIVP